MEALRQPLTNLQLEILKAFSYDLDNVELLEFKTVLAQYFAKRAVTSANKSWTKNGWNEAKVDELLNTKLRTSL